MAEMVKEKFFRDIWRSMERGFVYGVNKALFG